MKKLRLWTVTLLLLSFIFLPRGIASDVPFADVPFDVTDIPEPVPPPPVVRDFFDLTPFYQQWINVEGFPVLASEKVSPYAVKETAWHIKQMIGHRSDILKALAQNRVRFSIIAHNELTTDIPELRDLSPRFYYNVRQRGGSGGQGYRTTWAAEEHAFTSASVAIHELAHDIHLVALNQQIDPTFDNRLKTLFNAAIAKGLWHGVSRNYLEYWAEAVTVWFHVPQSSPFKTREALKAYDPDIALLIAEVFGDHDWRYTPIRMRTHLHHLQGFDPQSAPQLKFPPGVEEAYEELRNPNINERDEWVNLPPYDPSLLPKLNELRNRSQADGSPEDWTDILVVNTIDAEVLFYWVNPDGTETLHQRFPPNAWGIAHFRCRVGDLLLAKDTTGSFPLAVFQVVHKTGRALVSPSLNLITPGLSKFSGDNQSGLSGTVLANPFVVQVLDQNLSTLEGISVTFTTTAGDGTLSVTHTTTDGNGRAESIFTLGQNFGTNTVSVSAAGIEQAVTFIAIAEAVVDIPDPNLRAAIETALGKAEGDSITPSEMAALTRLEAQNANISDLTGLEHAFNLTGLFLGDTHVEGEGWINSNSIKDLSPLAGLTNLTRLNLSQNNITDLSPLAELTNLTWLDIGGNNLSNILPVSGLINLTALRLWRNNIEDISPVADLTHLTELSLDHNNISDISALASLTKLTVLRLWSNNISDISPLVSNTGLGSGDTVYVRQNRLNDQSLYTHIPALQSRGVIVEFDNRAPTPTVNTNGMVRLVYFLPNDRPARPDRVAALSQLIKEAQQFYAAEMHRHGFGQKTFTIETDTNGEPLVHQINGKFREDYYYNEELTDFSVWAELIEYFDEGDLQHVYFIAIDLSYQALDAGKSGGLGGASFFSIQGDIGFGPAGKAKLRHRHITMGEELLGGFALIPSHGHNFERLGLTLHELGHALGLAHDFREGRHSDYVMAVSGQKRLSKCAAEWLSVSRFFNTKSTFLNEPGEIQLLSLQPYSQDAISFRFKVTDPDGLHQAQLLVPEILNGTGWGPFQLFDCKRFNGTTGTVESVVRTAELVDRVMLQIIDVGGNITWATFPIQLDEIELVQNGLDVNSDSVVNLLDLTPFVSRFGQSGQDQADVNGDGVVDIIDVLLVAGGSSSVPRQAAETFTTADVQKWLTDANQLEVENVTLQKGIVVLEYLLAEITLLSTPMEVATSPLKAIFVGHTDHVWSVAFSPDGGTLASGSWDNTIRLWNPHTGKIKMTLIGDTGHIGSVAFSPDGQTLASGSRDRTIRLWNPHTGKLKRTLPAQPGSVASVAFSPDGELLASGGDYQTLLLWNTTTWQVERQLTGHTGLVDVVVFSRNGEMLASSSRDKTIRLWDPYTGTHIRTLTDTDTVNRLAFSPDGGTLVSGSWDKTIRLWNPHTGKLKRTLPNQGGWVNPVVFSPDGGTLVIGNRGISLWDVETGQYKKPLIEYVGDAISIVFSLDGRMLASGSADKKVRLWDFTPADTSSDEKNGDINGDGSVNVLDLIVIASELGNEGQDLTADVNRDEVVSILDLILVAGMFDGAAAAPSAQPQVPETLTAVEVQQWLTDARALEVRDPIMKRGFVVLEQLLISLTPRKTELLSNYPNPFNPETWIPYRLAEDANVTLTIYDSSGQVIRTLNLGHRIAAVYENRSKAIHWDGRNNVGERVASGIYFYTLTTGEYSATRRMVILK